VKIYTIMSGNAHDDGDDDIIKGLDIDIWIYVLHYLYELIYFKYF